MKDADGGTLRVVHRVKGINVLEPRARAELKRLRETQQMVERFGRLRAEAESDLRWARTFADAYFIAVEALSVAIGAEDRIRVTPGAELPPLFRNRPRQRTPKSARAG